MLSKPPSSTVSGSASCSFPVDLICFMLLDAAVFDSLMTSPSRAQGDKGLFRDIMSCRYLCLSPRDGCFFVMMSRLSQVRFVLVCIGSGRS